ncbi:MAG: RDD family protein [Defluviitaleaceae bacterium]|nr:RDD family protein [Defluviitaleaceae bacterium]
MKSIFVTTPDNIEVEYRLAGAGSRLGAVIIDTLIQFGVFLIIILAALWTLFSFDIRDLMVTFGRAANVAAVVLLLYFIIFFGYFIVFEIIMKGRTPGKKVFGLRTIRTNGQPITFIQSIIRNILRLFIDNTGLGIIMMMLTKNHTRFGDMLAGTIVISENPSKYSTKSLVWKPENYEENEKTATIDTKYPLTYEEYEIIKDYFARKEEFLENGRYAGIRISEYFARKFNIDKMLIDMKFLQDMMAENMRVYRG